MIMDETNKLQYGQNDKEKEKPSQRLNLDQRGPKETDLDVLYKTQLTSTSQKDIEKKITALKLIIDRDLKAADLKWSLFVAACNTYRYNSCLKPFPPMYIKNECKDIEALRRAVEVTPPMAVILKASSNSDVYEKYGATVDLLHWVLVRLNDLHVQSIEKERCEPMLREISSEMSAVAPNLIFRVTPSRTKKFSTKGKWQAAAKGKLLYAYHGSRLENFHSIIHYGLQQNMCKRSQFGKGIYLSSELGASLPYSPVGYGWGGSVLGSEISCVALCELINHAGVEIRDSGKYFGWKANFLLLLYSLTFKQDKVQSLTTRSVGQVGPNKDYLVTNSELVKVRYLLVYNQQMQAARCNNNDRGLLAWFKQHKLLTFVLGYVVLLTSVGLTHNKQVEKYYKLFIQKIELE